MTWETFGSYTTGGVTYNGLFVARDTDIAKDNLAGPGWLPTWWTVTKSQTALDANNPHQLHRFINLLLVSDGNKIHTIDDSLVITVNRLVLPFEYQVLWMADDGFRVYIGTRHTRGGEALVFPWNGTSETYEDPISAKDNISLAGLPDENGVIHIVNGKGQLMAYNGESFVEVAVLPIINYPLLRWAPDQARGQKLNPNGICLVDGKINMMIDGRDKDGNFVEEMPSGIWEYDKESGLCHKYAIGQYDGSTNNEWGASQIIVAGALAETQEDKGKILAGAEIYIDNASTKYEVMCALKSEANQRGYITTPQILATNIRGFWKRINLAFKKFENSTDRIIVKYRTEKEKEFLESNGSMNYFGITWTDTDTFTLSDAMFDHAVVGDEIEFLLGKGAGTCAHISSITGTTPNYTVNLDEAIPNAAGTGLARVQNWKKLGAISDTAISKQLYKIIKRSKWIQLKIEMRGGKSSPELEEILIDYEESKR